MNRITVYSQLYALVVAIMLAGSTVLVSSCASTPSPDTGEGTLLAIPALYFSNGPVDLNTNIYYIVTLYRLDTEEKILVTIPSYKGDDYILVDSLPEGRYRITEYESKNYVNDMQWKFNNPEDFMVKKGEVTISPYKFVSRIEETSQINFYTYYVNFIPVDEKQHERMMNVLRANPDFAAWFNGL